MADFSVNDKFDALMQSDTIGYFEDYDLTNYVINNKEYFENLFHKKSYMQILICKHMLMISQIGQKQRLRRARTLLQIK